MERQRGRRAQGARARDIAVYVVGVGTTSGGLIPEPPARLGSPLPASRIRAVLDRGSLQAIARAGGGDYFEMGRESDRDIARSILTGIKRQAPVLHVDESYEELYWYLLFAAALVLCLATVVLKSGAELWWQLACVAGTIVVVTIALG